MVGGAAAGRRNSKRVGESKRSGAGDSDSDSSTDEDEDAVRIDGPLESVTVRRKPSAAGVGAGAAAVSGGSSGGRDRAGSGAESDASNASNASSDSGSSVLGVGSQRTLASVVAKPTNAASLEEVNEPHWRLSPSHVQHRRIYVPCAMGDAHLQLTILAKPATPQCPKPSPLMLLSSVLTPHYPSPQYARIHTVKVAAASSAWEEASAAEVDANQRATQAADALSKRFAEMLESGKVDDAAAAATTAASAASAAPGGSDGKAGSKSKAGSKAGGNAAKKVAAAAASSAKDAKGGKAVAAAAAASASGSRASARASTTSSLAAAADKGKKTAAAAGKGTAVGSTFSQRNPLVKTPKGGVGLVKQANKR